jgi:hypothetical protein
MGYSEIDPHITRWADRHALVLSNGQRDNECRSVWVSSEAGECFQIWVELPCDGHVTIWAGGVESRRDDEPADDWRVSIDRFDEALEEAFQAVMAWMLPSKRYFPNVQKS